MSVVHLCTEVPTFNSNEELHVHERQDTILRGSLKKRATLRRCRKSYHLVGRKTRSWGCYLLRTAMQSCTRRTTKGITSHKWKKLSNFALFSAQKLTQEILKNQLDQQVKGNVTKDLLQGLEKRYPAYKELVRAIPHLVKLLPVEIQPDALIEKSPKATRVMFLLARRFGYKYDRTSETPTIEQD